MINLKEAIDRVIYNMTVKAMLDPENEYFYIPRLTLQKVEVLCDNDDDKTEMFWLCFQHAYKQYMSEQYARMFEEPEIETYEEYQERLAYENSHSALRSDLDDYYSGLNIQVCPECNCKDYIDGCSCPNCDYKK